MRATIAVLALLAFAGCSDIPAGGDPADDPGIVDLARAEGRLPRIAVAPLTTLALATDEAAKGWSPDETDALDREAVRSAVARALGATGRYERVREAADPDPLGDAWRARDEIVTRVSIEQLATRYDGRNGMFVPNMFIWFLWMVPSWWVATEKYTLAFEAHVEVESADSHAVLFERSVPVEVSGTFDEWDRGFQFFGFVYASLGAENWRNVASRLFPEARRRLAVLVARTLDEGLRGLAGTPRYEEARHKTLVLAVGLERYRDGDRFPPLPGAASDARRVAQGVLAATGDAPEHAALLLDDQATVAAVTSWIAGHLGRAREGDAVVVYFAGYGTRTAQGEAALVLDDGEVLTLRELAGLLAPVGGRKLLVIDAGFGGRGRSIGGPGGAGRDELLELAADPGLSVILAGSAGDAVLSPSHLGGGLLTFQFLRALEAGDANRDGLLSAQEIFDFVRPGVSAEASLLGESESPRGSGLDRGFALRRAR